VHLYVTFGPQTRQSCPLAVVGQEELDSQSVNVRNRDDVGTKAKGEMVTLDEITAKLVGLKKSRSLLNKLV
jgi:threonyl-tRNA synthetase